MSRGSMSTSSLLRRGQELLEMITTLINSEHCIHLRSDVANYISETLLLLQAATRKQYNDKLELIQAKLKNKLEMIRGMSVYSPSTSQHRFTVMPYMELEELWLYQCPPSTVLGLYSLRKNLIRLIIEYSGVTDLADVLAPAKRSLLRALQPMILSEKAPIVPNKYCWSFLTVLKITNCGLVRIDEAMHFFPSLVNLDLSNNQIMHIAHLQDCYQLEKLNLSHNRIRVLSNLERVLGKVKWLNLSHNEIESLDGLDKVYSLEHFDISSNFVGDITEVHHLGRLPCLEQLILQKNPIAELPHYRLRVFGIFIQVGSIMNGNRSFPVLDKFSISNIEQKQLRKLTFRSPVNNLAESTIVDTNELFQDFSMFDMGDGDNMEEDAAEEDNPYDEGNGEEVNMEDSQNSQKIRIGELANAMYPEVRSVGRRSLSLKRTGSVNSMGRMDRRNSSARLSVGRDRGGKRLSIESRLARFSTALSDAVPNRRASLSSSFVRKSPMKVRPRIREKHRVEILDSSDKNYRPSFNDIQLKLNDMVAEYGFHYLIDPVAAVSSKRNGETIMSLNEPVLESSSKTISLDTANRADSTSQFEPPSALTAALNGAGRMDLSMGKSSDMAESNSLPAQLVERSISASYSTEISHEEESRKGQLMPGYNNNAKISPRMASFSTASSFAASPNVPVIGSIDESNISKMALNGVEAANSDGFANSLPNSSFGSFKPTRDIRGFSDGSKLPISTYVGDAQYRDLIVSENLDLYFREQVFSVRRPCFPRFHLKNPNSLNAPLSEEVLLQPYEADEKLVCIYTERMIELTDIIGSTASFSSSFARTTSTTVSSNKGRGRKNIPADEGYAEDDEDPVKELLVTVILTDVGLYILDHNEILSRKVHFDEAPVFSVMKAHPLYTLCGLTIFFGFQRFSLTFFENPGAQNVGKKAVYLMLTRDKARTYPMITKIPQVANLQRASHSLLKLTNVKIENNDAQLLEQTLKYIHSLGTARDDIMHYQMVYQVFKERPTVRLPRTVIITQSSIMLCRENLQSNRVELAVIDSYQLKDIHQIFAEENALFVTVLFRRTNMLARKRKWRFCTEARNLTTKLIEECKSACLEIGNDPTV
eukprot:gene8177-9018_t